MSTNSTFTLTLLFLCCILLHQITCKPSRCDVMGVHPDECSKYNSAKDPFFYCGGATDKKIPLKYVNDDYCDCVHSNDDEPGTSACNQGKFWCTNLGYRGRFIYSSLVNDGLCDCCDGSDEKNNPRSHCPNICSEKAKEEMQEFIEQKNKYMEGIKVKNTLLQIAKSKLHEKGSKKEEIMRDLQVKKAERSEKETLKKIAEEKETNYKEKKKQQREAEKAQKEADRVAKCAAEGRENCEDENENENEAQNVTRIDTENAENIGEETRSERRRRDRRERYEERAEKRRTRRKARKVREIEAENEGEVVEEHHEHTPDEEFPYPEQYKPHEVHEQADGHHEHTPDEEFPYPEQYRPHDMDDTDDGDGDIDIDSDGHREDDDGFDWSEFMDEEEDMDIYDDVPAITEEEEEEEKDPIEEELTDKAREARNGYNDVDREVRKLEDELKAIEKVLGMDFGEKNIYAALFDECYSTKISKYDYEFCAFGKALQKEGSSSTDLGSFTSFGYNDKMELVMSFEDGQKCWNGPKRSASVLFVCDTDNEIINVSEPSTCRYSMTFHTPLACQQEELDRFTELINNQFKTEL